MTSIQSSEDGFTVTNQLSAERPQVVRKEMNAPHPALSAYAMFFKETQTSIKSEQSDADFSTVQKIVETMWKVLGDEQRQKYEAKSQLDKERYEQEMIAYRASKVEQRTTAPPSVPVTPVATKPGAAICIRLGCGKQSVRNPEWEDEYCSNQCVVLHCDYVFREWVRDQAARA